MKSGYEPNAINGGGMGCRLARDHSRVFQLVTVMISLF